MVAVIRSLYGDIAVTSDLGRVTTVLWKMSKPGEHCGDVRSRTSYNTLAYVCSESLKDCGDVRSRTSYN